MAKQVQLNEELSLNGKVYPKGEKLSISDELFKDLGLLVTEVKVKAEPKK